MATKVTIQQKADQALDKGLVNRHKDFEDVWYVGSVNSEKTYRVQFGEGFVTCTCPHGMNKGGGEARCYHVLAATVRRATSGYRV